MKKVSFYGMIFLLAVISIFLGFLFVGGSRIAYEILTNTKGEIFSGRQYMFLPTLSYVLIGILFSIFAIFPLIYANAQYIRGKTFQRKTVDALRWSLNFFAGTDLCVFLLILYFFFNRYYGIPLLILLFAVCVFSLVLLVLHSITNIVKDGVEMQEEQDLVI
ncbi:DUF2975 domain-containing protein [Peptoniphilus sp. KCTC 25270]|uniref:DUF2975 domain-containing protein n=1 Tax=Peptoniphilus sp. KCTC 25270 TaxID=2897414 RepID=UPI001E642306|nr:DUF2975 domain-containing protein [Peptoniphilus sp. KCTC 25270]MCD1146560.1 DUF2975 domain-containing protein [Peptoniphilus sp. KCTC 25270]